MNLSPHFTLQEAVVSQEAARRGINNQPDDAMLDRIKLTADFMENVRRVLDNKPILVTSWYRCDALERIVAGLSVTQRSSGHHPLGAAVDFHCPGFGSVYEVAVRLADQADVLGIGQLIYEYGSWIHVSRLPVPRPEYNRVLTIASGTGTRTGIQA